jgi:regulatory protein CII
MGGYIKDQAPANDLPAILSRVVDAKAEYDIRLLAQQLGTNYRSLMYWLRGERPMPAYLLPRICVLLKNYEALDCLESESGRVAFKIPEPHVTSEKELLAVSHLIREVGEALESVAETIADGTVVESELKTTLPKLEAVIQECASLKYLLEDLCKKKKGKRKADRTIR